MQNFVIFVRGQESKTCFVWDRFAPSQILIFGTRHYRFGEEKFVWKDTVLDAVHLLWGPEVHTANQVQEQKKKELNGQFQQGYAICGR